MSSSEKKRAQLKEVPETKLLNKHPSKLAQNMPVGGPSDERMSWGLHFYEEEGENLIKDASLVPEIHGSAEDGDVNVDHPAASEELDPLSSDDEKDKDQTKEVVDWKYDPPKELRKGKIEEEKGDAKPKGKDAVILESGNESSLCEDDDDDDPFMQHGEKDIFYEQRMLQAKIESRPERVTYQEEVARSSYQASIADSSEVAGDADPLDIDVKVSSPKFKPAIKEDLIELEDYDPAPDKSGRNEEDEVQAAMNKKLLKKKMKKKMRKNQVSFKYNVKLARMN